MQLKLRVDGDNCKEKNLTTPFWIRFVNRVILVAGTALIPFFLPYFDVMLCLLGSVFSILVSFILPMLFYLSLYDKIKSRWRIWMGVYVSVALAVLSTIVILMPGVRPVN